MAEELGENKLDRILSKVFKKKPLTKINHLKKNSDISPYKIIAVTASDHSYDEPLCFIAASVEMAEKKAELMTYKNPEGHEVPLDDRIRNMKYYKDGVEHAKSHKPCGNPSCDAFFINSYSHEE